MWDLDDENTQLSNEKHEKDKKLFIARRMVSLCKIKLSYVEFIKNEKNW